MEQAIVTFLSLISFNNIVMSVVKWLAAESSTRLWLRCMLVSMSAIGILANAAASGSQIDLNQINQLVAFVISTGLLSLASHFSYKVIKLA